MNDRLDELRQQYGCGPVQFSGADEALYNRHLLFDDVIDPFKATPREQFEAMARSLRDVISQRWLLTEKTYEEKNPKRVYYLSMEFLLAQLAQLEPRFGIFVRTGVNGIIELHCA